MEDEFQFIKNITPKQTNQSSLVKGIGDDAALFRGSSDYEEIVCVDTMVEDVHFNRKTMPPWNIGYKALAANVSDVAAMGGIPTYYVVSIAIPPTWKDEEVYEIYQGMTALASTYKMDVIGGDTVSTSDRLVISVTVLGRVEKGRHLLRENAKPGDIAFVTGDVGASAAGLELLLQFGHTHLFTENEQKLVDAHQRPLPQVKAGRVLAESGLRLSLNDISDGIASEVNEIAEASHVKIVIDREKIPFASQLHIYSQKQIDTYGLFGGEDFQLIGTVAKSDWPQLTQKFGQAGITVSRIGEVYDGESKAYIKVADNIIPLEKSGYNHFNR
ncbi:thiamine-phosphate kinase [Desertibacillus haloalkaliphilus]|uniref:thiamine-phosphate kinase n=1 Tax=Desertibacillus haloalkaliphilus TaxID=1328930 RepID=UPI001C25739B|nr:thiamine-phosphate kinase [Desertibacillus haloalkaliphilus]MBU8908569.1 thiamine-phosphate kinase [Desertibacillus haloalkaliphilus]